MNRADIRAWLASEQDLALGRALYAQLGTSQVYQRLFALGETDYSRPVLVRELGNLLQEVAAQSVADATPPPAPTPAPALPSPAPVASPDEVPVLQQLAQQLQAVRDERSYLHPQLTAKNMGTKARLAVCLRIVALTKQEVELKACQAHVRLHGRLPGPVALAEVTDAGELRQRLLNLRSRRSKLRKDPARALDLASVESDIQVITAKLTS